MAKRGGRREALDGVLGDQRVGTREAAADGVEVQSMRDGRVVLIPRAFRKMSAGTREAVFELQDMAAHLAELQRLISEAVLDAREEGASWNIIGWALGTTGEAARQRWGELAR